MRILKLKQIGDEGYTQLMEKERTCAGPRWFSEAARENREIGETDDLLGEGFDLSTLT